MLWKSVLLLFLCLDCLCLLDALKVGDNGVCTYTKSIFKTRRRPRPVTVAYKCGKKKCTKRIYTEKYIVKENSEMCCSGWVYNSNENVCNCLPPTRPHPTQRNVCFTPECSPSCHGAACVDANTCQCLHGYTHYNATHCANCEPGYIIDEHLNCQPKCDSNCTNSICSAPNVCTCNDGYKPNAADKFSCEPICMSCVNAACVGPNQCACHDGYKPLNSTHCVPKCDSCDDGDCIAPGHCVCHDGYSMTENGCEPNCAKCVNGFCVAPDTCECFEGFVFKVNSPNVCYKPCSIDCLGQCLNGECIEECKAVKM